MSKINKINFLGQKSDNDYENTIKTAEFIIAVIVLSGFLSSIRSIMYNNMVLWAAILTGTIILGIQYISERLKKFEKISSAGIYIAAIVCFFIFIIDVARGFLCVANRLIILWNLKFGTELKIFSVSSDTMFSSIIFWSLAAVPLSYFIFSLVKRRLQSCIIAIIIVGILFGFVLGKTSMTLSAVCMIFGIVGIMIFSLTPQRRIGFSGLTFILLTFAIFCGMFFLTMGYKGSQSIALWKKELSQDIEKIRYGEDTLPHGELKKADRLLNGDEDTLEIAMDYPQDLYLIGFVGGKYTGNEWETLDKEAYQDEYDGLMDWLEQEGVSPIKQYSIYDKLDRETKNQIGEGYNTVKVNNIGAYRKFVYLPHSAVSWKETNSEAKKDWQVQSKKFFGAGEYEFKDVIGAPNADGMVISPWIRYPSTEEQEKYSNTESVYHHFVEDKYMDIDDELKNLIYEKFFPQDEYEHMDFNEITMQIRTVLRREMQYTDFPNPTDNDKDFIKSFLTDSKSGNAVHYASAAVMAYRALGYPARYAEGYYCTLDDTDEIDENNKITKTLTNKNAHVWAEVYVSGAGWMPVEVVPGMYVETYTNQIVEGKPAYQISSKQEDDGIDVEADDVDGIDIIGDKPEEKDIPFGKLIPAAILLILYICFFIYLILELQRIIRILCRRKLENELKNEKLIYLYAVEMKKILQYAGVTGNYNHPLELTEDVNKKLQGISKNGYERAVFLIQKVRFGGKELRKDEKYVLSCFILKLKRELYKNKGFFGKLILRYGYAIEK